MSGGRSLHAWDGDVLVGVFREAGPDVEFAYDEAYPG